MAKTKAMCVRSGGAPKTNASSSPGAAGSPAEASSPKSVVGSYDLDTVALKWDDTPAIRERLRSNDNLLLRQNHETRKTESGGFIEATQENLVLNACVVKPVCVMMSQNLFQLPGIEALLSAIESFYVICKVSRTSDSVYQEGWAIRRLIGRVKKILYRNAPPQDHMGGLALIATRLRAQCFQ